MSDIDMKKIAIGFVALTLLAGCTADGGSIAPPPPSSANAFGLDEESCKISVMQRASTADVDVLNARQTDNGVLVRLGVGPDQTPWRCRSFSDGSVGDIGPIRDRGNNNPNRTAGNNQGGGDFGLDEAGCTTAVMSQANTADVTVLNARQTDNGVLVRLGVGQDRTPWRCRSFADGTTGDVGPIQHNRSTPAPTVF